MQRYSIYSAVFAVAFFVFIAWLFLVYLAPKKTPIKVTEKRIEKSNKIIKYDPWREYRVEAYNNGLESRIVIAVVKSEKLLMPYQELEGSCRFVIKGVSCVETLAKINQDLEIFLNRKPTISDLVLAHAFGMSDSIRISRLIGSDPIEKLGEELLKSNEKLKAFKNIRDFRIWLRRTLYR